MNVLRCPLPDECVPKETALTGSSNTRQGCPHCLSPAPRIATSPSSSGVVRRVRVLSRTDYELSRELEAPLASPRPTE